MALSSLYGKRKTEIEKAIVRNRTAAWKRDDPKTTLVNIRCIDYAEVSFGGALMLKLKNKEQDYVSRTYLSAFKKAIGI